MKCFSSSSSSSLVPYVVKFRFKREIKVLAVLKSGALITIMNSYSHLGPSFNVILLVRSFVMGFSMNQQLCFTSEFSMSSSFTTPYSFAPYSSLSSVFLQTSVTASVVKSTICSCFDLFCTRIVLPRIFPEKNLPQLRIFASTSTTYLMSIFFLSKNAFNSYF